MKALSAATVLALSASPAYAGFFGNEIRVEWRRPEFDIIHEAWTFFPDDNIELPRGSIPSAEAAIDITDDSIYVEVFCDCTWGPEPFNGFLFRDVNDTMPAIIGFSLDRSEGLMGLKESDVQFNENEIWANFAGINSDDENGWWFRINVEFIPAPSALALFGLAAFTTKRRRRSA